MGLDDDGGGARPPTEQMTAFIDETIPRLCSTLCRPPFLVSPGEGSVPLQLIVTTTNDDLLERALEAAGQEVDVIAAL